MVDAVTLGHGSLRSIASKASASTTVTISSAGVTARDGYRAFAELHPCGPAQHPDWVEAWARTQSSELVILSIFENGTCVLQMPLEITGKAGMKVARAIGGHHANGNFPPAAPGFSERADRAAMARALTAIRSQRPDIDLLLIERQSAELGGRRNPLALLGASPSPNIALAVDLRSGFGAILERVGRKRRLKKHRAQTRKLDAAGGFRRYAAADAAEVDRVLGDFLAMKADRFAKLGISDVFADMRPFFSTLFKLSLGREKPAFVLHALEVGDKIRAVTGSSVVGDRLICEFGGIVEDELAQASPGDFMFFENIEEAARSGFSIYDFSVGDEGYKRAWCDLVVQQFDTVAPLSAKGHALAYGLRGIAGAKRVIKSNERLWTFFKTIRRKRGAAEKPAEPESDD